VGRREARLDPIEALSRIGPPCQKASNLGRPLAQTPDDVRGLHQMCREGWLLYDVERWIADGKSLQLAPEAIRRGTRPKTALQIALEGSQHSLAFLALLEQGEARWR